MPARKDRPPEMTDLPMRLSRSPGSGEPIDVSHHVPVGHEHHSRRDPTVRARRVSENAKLEVEVRKPRTNKSTLGAVEKWPQGYGTPASSHTPCWLKVMLVMGR